MASNGIIQVANETFASSSRITKEGRKITYRMKVIQQPERARACGSGAKSSADRRPVDPPPIVELRIYEGVNAENEITFNYNANFFLFATLDNARHIAHGRVPQPSQPSFPVLTGTPVAGMAYLDRPAPAGYFIFPDLSVRHEGRYRLSFSLYEELKETKDLDTETADNNEIQKSAHVSHRLEVKSQVFTVFSAKKFPGLTESTALSRMVAEQGCRVRIRRDVRMRRRESKANRDYDYDDDDDHYNRGRASATPDAYHHGQMSTPQAPSEGIDRPRSVSNASNGSYMPQRRPSLEQLNQGYQQQYPPPLAPTTPGMYPPPSQPMQQWQQPQQPVSYMHPPAPPSYPAPQGYQQQPPPSTMASQYGFMPPQYPTHHGHARHNSLEIPPPPSGPSYATSSPQTSMPQYPSASQAMSPYPSTYGNKPAQMNMQPAQGHSMPNMQQPATATSSQYPSAPVQSPSMVKPEQQSYPMPNTPSVEQTASVQDSQYEYNGAAPPKFSYHPQPTGGTKRTYSSTFDTEHLDGRLQQGARPSSSAADPKYPYAVDGDDEPLSFEEAAMSYRRADGTERRRRVPLSA